MRDLSQHVSIKCQRIILIWWLKCLTCKLIIPTHKFWNWPNNMHYCLYLWWSFWRSSGSWIEWSKFLWQACGTNFIFILYFEKIGLRHKNYRRVKGLVFTCLEVSLCTRLNVCVCFFVILATETPQNEAFRMRFPMIYDSNDYKIVWLPLDKKNFYTYSIFWFGFKNFYVFKISHLIYVGFLWPNPNFKGNWNIHVSSRLSLINNHILWSIKLGPTYFFHHETLEYILIWPNFNKLRCLRWFRDPYSFYGWNYYFLGFGI